MAIPASLIVDEECVDRSIDQTGDHLHRSIEALPPPIENYCHPEHRHAADRRQLMERTGVRTARHNGSAESRGTPRYRQPGPCPTRSAFLDRLEACRYTAAVG